MARKSNRQYRKSTRSRPSLSSPTSTSSRRGAEFEPDYGYVIKDLKRIGLYAGLCIAILLVLTFIF